MRVVPRVQSKLSRALHAYRGRKLLQDLQTQKSAAKKRAMVKFRGAREKGAMAFVECLGFSQEVLGRVVAASARGNLPSLLERLPERPMASALIEELKIVATEAKRRQIEDAVGSSWAALAAEEDPHGRGIGTLLVEAGAGGGGRGAEGRERSGGERGGRGDGGVGQREQWEDSLATQPDSEIELSQTNREVGGVCVRVVPRVQSKLSRALHAHRGKKLLQDLQTQKSAAKKRAMVKFRGARGKGAMAFVECLGFSQEDTMEGPLWRETLSRSVGSHGATELVGGMCYGNGCRQETSRLHPISCTKTGWSSLTHNRVLHQALVRSLRESKVQFVVEDTWPFRQRASEQNGRLNPLRMDITTEAGALFDNHPRLNSKALLLDITIVNPCAGSNLGNAARHVGKHLADAVEREENNYRGSFPATYSLLPLAMSTCGDVGSDVHTVIKELAIRRVQHRSEIYSNESQHLGEETEVARLRRRFSLFYSRHSHSARVIISADRGWRLRAPDSPVRKARRLFKRIVPGR